MDYNYMEMVRELLIVAIGAYLIGSIPTMVILSKHVKIVSTMVSLLS